MSGFFCRIPHSVTPVSNNRVKLDKVVLEPVAGSPNSHHPAAEYGKVKQVGRFEAIRIVENHGRYLENAVFLSLRRRYQEIYYYSGEGECDFVIMDKGKAQRLVQVCYQLTADNSDRELKGLVECMRLFNITRGEIITMDQEDSIKQNDGFIDVKPFHLFA